MRWSAQPKPRQGDLRTVTRFALWPTRIGDSYVWLEKFTETQIYRFDLADLVYAWCRERRQIIE